MRIGLISDTHGLIRPDALTALGGVELILHAGDVGGAQVLRALREIAPVRAVRGNVDDRLNPDLEPSVELDVQRTRIHLSHGDELGIPTPDALLARYPADVIVYGHTHRAVVHRAESRLVVNPGAAGPARFNLKPSVAVLSIDDGGMDVRIVAL